MVRLSVNLFFQPMELKIDPVKTRNKELTKRKLIDAVGAVMKKGGYQCLGVNQIAKHAGVHKKLIYRYFGSIDYLIETYIMEKDFWLVNAEKISDLKNSRNNKPDGIAPSISALLEEEFNFLFTEPEMQKIIHWQISEKTSLIRSISNVKDTITSDILRIPEGQLMDADLNFSAVISILIGGIHYAVLNAKNNGSTICGLDINRQQDRDEFIIAIKLLVSIALESRKKLKIAHGLNK